MKMTEIMRKVRQINNGVTKSFRFLVAFNQPLNFILGGIFVITGSDTVFTLE